MEGTITQLGLQVIRAHYHSLFHLQQEIENTPGNFSFSYIFNNLLKNSFTIETRYKNNRKKKITCKREKRNQKEGIFN